METDHLNYFATSRSILQIGSDLHLTQVSRFMHTNAITSRDDGHHSNSLALSLTIESPSHIATLIPLSKFKVLDLSDDEDEHDRASQGSSIRIKLDLFIISKY